MVLAVAGTTPVWGTTTVVSVGAAPQAPAVRYSPGIADIVKMVQAKVDVEVIKAYIKNSWVPFNPSAEEIIALQQSGVSDDIISAMLQRGGEIRAQARAAMAYQGGAAPPPYPAANPYAPTPAYPGNDYGTTPAYPGYDYGTATTYPDYSYDYPAYAYGYGYPDYGYGYGYPWGVGFDWPFYFGFYPFHHDFDRFHGFGRGFDRFHGRVGGFGGRVGGGFRSVPSRGFGGGGRASFGGRVAGGGFRGGGSFHGGGFGGGGFRGGGGGHGGGGHR